MSKSASSSSGSTLSKRPYASVEFSDDLRRFVGAQYNAWRARGYEGKDYHALLEEANYSIPRKTVESWAKAVASRGEAIRSVKRSGRSAALNGDQVQVLVGYGYHRFLQDKSLKIKHIRKFVSKHFGVSISRATAGKYIKDCGFTSKVSQTKTSGFQLGFDESCDLMYEWLVKIHPVILSLCGPSPASAKASSTPSRVSPRLPTRAAMPPDALDLFDRSLLASIDFVMTGHRTSRNRSFSPIGSKQPRDGKGYTNFTNCIVTCIWADGVDRTPSVLFSYNQVFRKGLNSTKRRDAIQAELDDAIKRYDLKPEQLVYVGKEKNEHGHYVSESSGILKHFLAMYDIPEGAVILSDNGRSLVSAKGSTEVPVLEAAGFKKHICYPAAVHQFLSPNDNELHGAAKQKWRNMGDHMDDDIESSCALLHVFQAFNVHVPSWFDKNMQLDVQTPTLDRVKRVIKKGDPTRDKYLEDGLRSYRVHKGLDARGVVPITPKGLDNSLDGLASQPLHKRRRVK